MKGDHMSNLERLLTTPIEAARLVGRGVLYLTERFVPPAPSIETQAASITFISTGEGDVTDQTEKTM
jgi:hypothetical protein